MQPADPPSPDLIRAELERILASPSFRTAKRSQDFLRYIVTNALEGKTEYLKERAIGASVFEREPDYDTGGDSIVRVKASELRKRLAQYYQDSGSDSTVQIQMPAGSYSPEFRWIAAGVPAPKRRPWQWIALAALLLLGGAMVWFLPRGGTSKLDEFWKPVLQDARPVVLCVAHPVVFHVSGTSLPADRTTWPKTLSTDLLTRDPDHYVGLGDAFALAQLNSYFKGRGKDTDVRIGNDVSFADLRQGPVVLIGAFTNQWTMQMTRDLRFVFDHVGGDAVLRDQQNAEQYWRRSTGETGDYVLVSRVFDSKTGNLIITAAGIGHLGTQMAGEFLTRPDLFAAMLADAPPDWARRNAQWVLRGEIIGRTAGPPSVAAAHYW
jgi:hypothetical protein